MAAQHVGDSGVPPPPEGWLAEILTEGLAREIPGSELHEWVRQCTETLRFGAVSVATTLYQTYGLCRELHDDFGPEAEGLTADEVRAESPPLPLRRADLVVSAEAHRALLGEIAGALRNPLVIVVVRPELRGGEWAQLLRRSVYAVATGEFAAMLERFYAEVPGFDNLRVLVYGRDDLSVIPEGGTCNGAAARTRPLIRLTCPCSQRGWMYSRMSGCLR